MLIPFESCLTKRGDRTPNLASFLIQKGYEVLFITTNFNHAEKSYFSDNYINKKRKNINYDLIVLKNIGYKDNISVRRVISHISYSLKIFIYLIFYKKPYEIIITQSRPPELIFLSFIIKLQ
jgi:hypothetical protein